MITTGSALESLERMESASVQCCITSPPYFGLRDYGTGEWESGDPACDHVKGELRRGVNLAESVHSRRGGAKKAAEVEDVLYGAECGKCGAQRTDAQIGLESTPDEYVAKLVAVFGEVKRVLRDDGTLWLNLGDSYNAYAANRSGATGRGADAARETARPAVPGGYGLTVKGLKSKDLLGIPWVVAFALRADGWYLRSEIIWAKPNPMPESVTDRPTKAHEQVFLLSKSARYYYDADAIREPDLGTDHPRSIRAEASLEPSNGLVGPHTGIRTTDGRNGAGANKRSVWTVATQPYPDAHFAAFPPKLIEPMVLAGCPRGGLVLDPFAGSGTTLAVAVANGRHGVGIELNPHYVSLATRRVAGVTPSMFDVSR